MNDREHRVNDSISIAQLRAVVAVSRALSFTAAAGILGVSQSVVSRSISSVEDAIGAQLLDRTTRRVHLTRAGEEFAGRAAQVLRELDSATDAAQQESGQVRMRLACTISVAQAFASEALAIHRERHPQLRLTFVEAPPEAIANLLMGGEADFGIANVGDLGTSLRSRPLWVERYHVVLPATHRLADRASVQVDELADEELITLPPARRGRVGLDLILAARGQLRRPAFIAQQYATAFSLVARGHGVLIAPSSALLNAPDDLSCPLVGDESASRTVGIYWAGSADLPAGVEGFIVCLLEVARPRFHPATRELAWRDADPPARRRVAQRAQT